MNVFHAGGPGVASRPSSVLDDLLPLAATDDDGHFVAADRVLPYALDTFLVAVSPRGAGCVPVEPSRARNEIDAVVRLTETATLEVTVVDGSGAGVAGARVVAEPRHEPLGTRRPDVVALGIHPVVRDLFSAFTDSAGRATLRFLPLGEAAADAESRAYDVRVDAPGTRTVRRAVELDPLQALAVTVSLHFGHLDRVHGVVLDPDRRPIAGARVSLDGSAATTDEQGRYELASVPIVEERLLFDVSAEGHLRLVESRPVPAEPTATFDFVLRASGRLWGVVVDQTGAPVHDAGIFLNGAERARTNAAGEFTVASAPGEPVAFTVMPPEPASEWTQTHGTVRAAEAPVRWILERLPPGIAHVTIEVVDAATGAPADANGSLHPALEHGPLLVMNGPRLTPAETRIGLRRYEGVRPGLYRLTVGERYERALDVPPGETDVRVRVELRRPGRVLGEIVLEGIPRAEWPERVTLGLWPTSRAGRFVAPEGGRLLELHGFAMGAELTSALGTLFVVEEVDPYQPIAVTALAHGFLGRADVEVDPGGETLVRLRLERSGHVELALSAPIAADRIELRLRRKGSSEWEAPRTIPIGRGSRTPGTVAASAGRYRWQVGWRPEGEAGPTTGPRQAVEGDIEIEANQTTMLSVDVARARPAQ